MPSAGPSPRPRQRPPAKTRPNAERMTSSRPFAWCQLTFEIVDELKFDQPYLNWALVIQARKNSPSSCRSVPHHHPARNLAGMVTPLNCDSSSTDTPNGQRQKGVPPGLPHRLTTTSTSWPSLPTRSAALLGVLPELPCCDRGAGMLALRPQSLLECGRYERDLPGQAPAGAAGDVGTRGGHHRDQVKQPPAHLRGSRAEPVEASDWQPGRPGCSRPDVTLGHGDDLACRERPPLAEPDLPVHRQFHRLPERSSRCDRVGQPSPGRLRHVSDHPRGEPWRMRCAGGQPQPLLLDGPGLQRICHVSRMRGPGAGIQGRRSRSCGRIVSCGASAEGARTMLPRDPSTVHGCGSGSIAVRPGRRRRGGVALRRRAGRIPAAGSSAVAQHPPADHGPARRQRSPAAG